MSVFISEAVQKLRHKIIFPPFFIYIFFTDSVKRLTNKPRIINLPVKDKDVSQMLSSKRIAAKK